MKNNYDNKGRVVIYFEVGRVIGGIVLVGC